MRKLNTLIDMIVLFGSYYQDKKSCICNLLDLMFLDQIINFYELRFLQKFINENIEIQFLDEVIETSNYSLFNQKLISLKTDQL